MDLHRWFMNFHNWIMGLHNWIYGDSWFELWSSISFDLWRSIIHNSIHGALQFAVMELQTICGDPSSTWWSSIIYILWSSMIEMSTEFHNKLGSSIIMIFVFSGTLCDYGQVKRTKALKSCCFRMYEIVKCSQNIEKSVLKALAGCNIMERCPLCCPLVRTTGGFV